MKTKFSKTWNSSKQPRKQRKYRYNAPLNKKQKLVSSHLSKTLKEKYSKRNLQIKKGDRVQIMRGQFKKKTGKVSRVDLKESKIFVEGIEIVKKDGTKIPYPINPSNILIEEVNVEDKKRLKSIERKQK